MLPIILMIVLLGDSGYSFAEKHEVSAIGEYTYGDRETREDAKRLALEDAKRNALEKIVVYVQSQTVVRNYRLIEDYIKSYTAGKMQILDRDFRFVGDKMLTCLATIRAVVDIDIEEMKNHTRFNEVENQMDSQIKNGSRNQNSVAKSKILDGAIESNGHYYKNFEIKLDWDSAKKFCEGVGGHLIIAESDAEIEILKKLSQKGSWNYWIGGYKDDNGIWRWVNGSVITGDYWHPGQPSSSASRNKMLVHSLYKDGKWNSHRKDETWGFICEWESAEDAHDSTL